jgi:hypothetical protein
MDVNNIQQVTSYLQTRETNGVNADLLAVNTDVKIVLIQNSTGRNLILDDTEDSVYGNLMLGFIADLIDAYVANNNDIDAALADL